MPGYGEIDLIEYYREFEWYYPDCELQTKEWIVKNSAIDFVSIDCGANIGYYSILLASLSPLGFVYAVEPTDTAEMCRLNLEHNGIKNYRLINLAISNKSGNRTDKIYKIWGSPPLIREFSFITLDKLVEDYNIKKLDLVKIDLDSYDYEALLGAEQTLLRLRPSLIVELNHALNLRQANIYDSLKFLASLGYTQAKITDKDNFIFDRRYITTASSTVTLDLA